MTCVNPVNESRHTYGRQIRRTGVYEGVYRGLMIISMNRFYERNDHEIVEYSVRIFCVVFSRLS